MKKAGKIAAGILVSIIAAAFVIAAVLYSFQYYSLCSRNTRLIEEALTETSLSEGGIGSVKELIRLDYDKLYVFEPYAAKGTMEYRLGFSSNILRESASEGFLNYLFVKGDEEAAYLYGLPENIGYCINLKSGVYTKNQLDEMTYEVQTRDVGNSSGEAKTYQDYNFYYEDQPEQEVDAVMVQSANAVLPVPVGEEITVSLNSEGTDTIRYALTEPDEENGYEQEIAEFTINGVDYKNELKKHGVEYPNTEHYYIVDLVASDEYKEIAIFDDGPSVDPQTFFFRYSNSRLAYLGSISDYPESATCHFQNQGNNQGEIVASFRLNLLQTWFAQGYWKLNENNKLVFEEQSVYYPISDYKAELLCELPVYEKKDKESKSFLMQPGEVSFQATDNKNWVQIGDKSGEQGWFYIEDYDTITDTGLRAEEVFSGLQIYD